MNHSTKERMFTSPLKRAIRLALLSLLACFFFYPALAQGQVRRLIFTVKTGDDDLRGGNDNLNVVVNFRDGNVQLKPNVNHGQRWADNTTESFDIDLQRPVALSELASVDFQKPTGKGLNTVGDPSGTDEWHMDSVSIKAVGDGIDKIISTHGFMRFNSLHQELLMPITMAVAGKANKLELAFKTGGDNLESRDDLDVTIQFRGGSTQIARGINGGQTWENGSTRLRTITLDQAVDPSDISKIVLKAGYSISLDSDNWDMESVSIRAMGEGVDKLIATHGFFRFTGNENSLAIPISTAVAGKANKLQLMFQTGGDDLRGDNDNLNVIIHFRGGQTQLAKDINGGKAWANGSMHVETITLNQAVDPSEIAEVDLQTTFTGGTGGDNWDMDSVIVKAIGEGVNEVILKGGPKRFTGDSKVLRLRRSQ